MEELKRVLAIHDLSGFGKCSLTVALPVISVAGIECTCMPTAILSTHTGGFTGYTFRDLSEDMYPMAKHWKSLGLEFDAIYIGYLGSSSQAKSVENIISLLKDDKTLVIIDPVMADNGEYYTGLDEDMCKGFLSMCKFADIITPNFTEATLLLGEKYIEPPYTKEYVEGLLKRLSDLGPSKVVLTGVSFKEGEVGAASYDKATNEISYAFTKRTPGSYHGTGDLFGSAFVAAIVRGISINKSIKIAVDLVKSSTEITYKRGTPTNYGVDFESRLQQFSIDIQNNINK
ncbi:pyridoxamine kinase [Clostridium algidicarnis]|uniref:Pyridoxamine kinase n=1 Tax=Clostridium algidicarnis TaxID=37659 RepID=A0ABS6C4I4_9CLOT|nr:pyridoxamine kinase [Clostridium algidicarnis]MBU3220399.1 pyridoxamine kinase [Clostridium algidicarnis]